MFVPLGNLRSQLFVPPSAQRLPGCQQYIHKILVPLGTGDFWIYRQACYLQPMGIGAIFAGKGLGICLEFLSCKLTIKNIIYSQNFNSLNSILTFLYFAKKKLSSNVGQCASFKKVYISCKKILYMCINGDHIISYLQVLRQCF